MIQRKSFQEKKKEKIYQYVYVNELMVEQIKVSRSKSILMDTWTHILGCYKFL